MTGLVLVLLGVAGPVGAQPDPAPAAPIAPLAPAAHDGEAGFRAASQRLLVGDLAGARAGFEAVVAAAPDSPWADQALLEAGAVAERQGELAAARGLYRRVLAEHPGARSTRLAEVRLAALDLAGGADGHWDPVAAEHERLVQAAAAGDPTARPAMAALLDRNPGYPRWAAAALWLADAAVRAGDHLDAAVWYRRVRIVATSPGERFRAGLGEAGGWRVLGELERARATLVALEPPDAIAAGARAQALEVIDRSRQRRAWVWAAGLSLAGAALAALIALRRRRGSWLGALRGLWPPPIEVAYLVPVAAALIFIGETGNPLAARAAESILLGAVVIGWGSGAVLRAAAARPGRAGMLVHVAIVVAATLAVIYLTVIREGLIDLLIETWRSGHEGR